MVSNEAAQVLIRGRWAALLAVLGGVMYFLAFPGPGLWPLGFVALVPLIVALRGRTPKHAFLLGWLAGFTTTLAGFWWLLAMLRRYSGFPTAVCVLLLALLSLYQGARMAATAWLSARATKLGWPEDVSFLVAFLGLEAIFPLLFPWYFGAVLHNVPVLIQGADLGGPILVSALLVVINAAITRIAIALLAKQRPSALNLTLALGTPLLFLVYGALRMRSIDAEASHSPALRVGMVQGNVPMDLHGAEAYADALRKQIRLSEELVRDGAQLVVWSESAFLYSVPIDDLQRSLARPLGDLLRVPHVLGIIVEQRRSGSLRTFNSALMVREGGEVTGRYDKRYLLPFGEYLPFGETFPKLYALSPESGRITPGESWNPLPFEDRRITALICYEDIVPSVVNEAVDRGHPHLLVNLTNDAWFGDTWEPWVHHALARFRAVEHHRYLVRATNSGVSSVIDPVGRVIARTKTFELASLAAEVRWMHVSTLYEWLGDVPWQLCAVGAAGMAFRRRRRNDNEVANAAP